MLRTSNRSWVSQASIDGLSPRTPVSPSHSLGLRARMPRGSARCKVRTLLNSSKRPLLRQKSSTTSTRPFLQWSRQTPLITPSPVFSRYAHKDGQVRPVAFFSGTLSSAELNYDTRDEQPLAIFEAFKTARHYLVSPPIRSTWSRNTRIWSTSLRQRCLRVVKLAGRDSSPPLTFSPRTLGEKPDSHTRRADCYLKGGDRDYRLANPQRLRPIFSQEQLATSLCATQLCDVAMGAAALVDSPVPIFDISAGLSVDPLSSRELDLCLKGSPSPRFSLSHSGLLLMELRVYASEYRPE